MSEIDINILIKAAIEAGAAIMEELVPDIVVRRHGDQSPYTDADTRSNEIILRVLQDNYPDIAIVSEENPHEQNQEAIKQDRHFSVDSLDGSATAIDYAKGKIDEKRKYQGFGVHIAYIENGAPKAGVVLFPARGRQGTLYYTGNNGKPYKQEGKEPPNELRIKKPPLTDLTASGSWREGVNPKDINGRQYTTKNAVGGERLCIVAEGRADVALFDHPTSHWDVAAGHAIMKAAGGEVVNKETGQPITYTNDDFSVPHLRAGSVETLKLLGISHSLETSTKGQSR